jgi:phospholipid transport system substrate-binding protein
MGAMMHVKQWFGLLLLGFSLSTPAAAMISEKDPVAQVQKVSDQLVSRLESERKQLEASNDRVNALAEELVFPYVDIGKMSRFVMGAAWRTATSEQQQTFVDLFKKLLLNSYARSFLKLQIDHIEFGASRAGSGAQDKEVPATVVEKNGNRIPVVFRLLPAGDSWKTYDVEIQGISLLLNYRGVYAVEIDQKGLPAVLAQMKAQLNGN